MLAHKISQNVANIPENYLVKVSDIHLYNTRYARRVGGGGSRGSNELPLVVNNGGLKTQTAGFQLLANSRGMGNKL